MVNTEYLAQGLYHFSSFYLITTLLSMVYYSYMRESHLPKIAKSIRRRGIIATVVGIFYALGGLALIGVLVFVQVSENAATIGLQQQFFMALNALGLFIGSGWYFYSGYRLYKLPPYAATKQILYVTLGISILSIFGFFSIIIFFTTLSVLRRLPEYHDWRESSSR